MQKRERHQHILDLIATRQIARQEELVRLLSAEGFSVTQASVSRDLEEMGIVKSNGRYVRREPVQIHGEYGPVRFSAAGDNLIVIKCGAGLASAAAVRIDAAAIPEIVGTIAGDDTIFIAVTGAGEQAAAIREIKSTLETNNGYEQN